MTLSGTSGALTITNTLTHKSGLLTFADRNIITGTFTRTGSGTYNATTGYLQVNSAFTQGTGFSIPNLAINGTYTVGTDKDFSVTGTLYLLSGTLTHKVTTVARLNIPVGGTVNVTAGALDVAPVYAGGYNLTYSNTGAITTGKEWPTAGNVKTLTIAGTSTVTLAALTSGTYTDSTAVVLTSGTFAIPDKTTLTLANGVAISKTGSATVTLTGTGAIVCSGLVDVTYNGTVTDVTGPELPTGATAIRNLTFTRTGNVNNFTTNNAQNITVNGTLTIGNDLNSTGTITALGNVIVAADGVAKATSPSISGAALTFSGTTDQTLAVPAGATTYVGSITINKPSTLLIPAKSLIISGGDLQCTGTVTFISGLVKTSATNALVLTNGGGGAPVNVGFVRNVATGGKSHVVGNVRQDLQFSSSIVYARNEFPVGDTLNYRPAALTFVISSAFPTGGNFGVIATVSHTASRPTGTAGLPIHNGVADGVDLAKYPSFLWSIKTDHDMGNSVFDLELTAAGFDTNQISLTDLGLNRIKIIRRTGFVGDTLNQWNLQGARDSYDNKISAGVPTVIAIGANSGLSPAAAIFTYGLKSNLAVVNAITDKTLNDNPIANRTIKIKLGNVFTGNTGALTYTAVSANTAIVTATMIGTTDTLQVKGLRAGGPIVVTVTAKDVDNSQISTTFNVTVTGNTGVEVQPNIPTEFSLSQNYPNPFNPSTTIQFGLPTASNVTLKVYNILGEEVANVVNQAMPAGYHTVVFDGSKLASGIYIYRIEAGNFVQVKKMMMLK